MCSSISNGNPICGLNISLVTNPTEDKEFEESIVSQINSIQTEIWKTINTLKTASEGNSDQLKNQFIQVIDNQLETYITIRNASLCGQKVREKIKSLEISLDDACLILKKVKGQFKLKDLFIPRSDIYHLKERLQSQVNG